MKVVIIDNYDSFTYNLAHLVKELGVDVTVYRNDQFQLRELEPFDKIILSPGPGIPSEAGLLMDVCHQEVCRHQADAGRMSGSSGDRRGVWRQAHQPQGGVSWCSHPVHPVWHRSDIPGHGEANRDRKISFVGSR